VPSVEEQAEAWRGVGWIVQARNRNLGNDGTLLPLNIKNGSVATSRSNHLKVFTLRNIEYPSAILFDAIDSLVLGNDGEIGSDAGWGCELSWSGLEPRQASLSRRLVGGEAISALTRLHCKTKLNSTEADSVPTS
jgi:hypothetical protein